MPSIYYFIILQVVYKESTPNRQQRQASEPKGRHTRRSSLPSVDTDGECRVYCSGCISSSSYLVYVGLVEDFDLFEPEQKGHSGVDQEIEESELRVAAKGKCTRARSGKDNSGSESKEDGLNRQTRNNHLKLW